MELYSAAAVETVSGIVNLMRTLGTLAGVGMVLAGIGGMFWIRYS
jgi:hypothetical protein